MNRDVQQPISGQVTPRDGTEDADWLGLAALGLDPVAAASVSVSVLALAVAGGFSAAIP